MSGIDDNARRKNMAEARIAVVSAIASFTLFVAITLIYYFTTWSDVDRQIARTLQDHSNSHSAVRGLFVAITELGTVTTLSVLASAGVLWCSATGNFRLALVWIIAAGGGSFLNIGVKKIVGRERPPIRDRAITESNESYPSGHSMGTIIGFGMLTFAVFGKLRTRPRQYTFVSVIVMVVILVGFSRIYLRAHWFSDVCAGFALGGAWLALCIYVYFRLTAQPATHT